MPRLFQSTTHGLQSTTHGFLLFILSPLLAAPFHGVCALSDSWSKPEFKFKRRFCVTSDDKGMVKLFNYPCVVDDAPHRFERCDPPRQHG